MQKFPKDWDTVTKISYLQRKIIISSIMYYEMDESPISDREYDELSKQLVELQKEECVKDSQYYYCFSDFDGTTGFDLRSRLTEEDNKYLSHLALLFSKGLVYSRQTEKNSTKKKRR